jgi:hypothetical protein
MDPAKVRTILDWPEPHKVKEVQSFIGFGNFYWRSIPNYSGVVALLTRLTRKDVPWDFSPSCRSAFTSLKEAFSSALVLTNFAPGAPLIIETDASNHTVAGILSSLSEDNSVHPIAYFSHTMSPMELNYNTHDKELLAIHKAFKTWQHYLEGASTPIDVVTDHKNLEYFSMTKLLSCHQACWSKFLSGFNLVIHFCPRKLGMKPDTLTRHSDVYPKGGDSDYASSNPHNFCPVFTSEQLAASLCTSTLAEPVLQAAFTMDIESLHSSILSAIEVDPFSKAKIALAEAGADPRWTVDNSGFLWLDGRIFVPDTNDL